MVAAPGDYAWSSYRANAAAATDTVVTPHPEYLRLGADPISRRTAYRSLFENVISDERFAEIRAYVQQQRALGTPRFQREIEAILGRCAQVRPAHRPRKTAAGTVQSPES